MELEAVEEIAKKRNTATLTLPALVTAQKMQPVEAQEMALELLREIVIGINFAIILVYVLQSAQNTTCIMESQEMEMVEQTGTANLVNIVTRKVPVL